VLTGCAINHSPIHTGLEPGELNAAVSEHFAYGQSMREVTNTLDELHLRHSREASSLGSGEPVEDRISAWVYPPGCRWTLNDSYAAGRLSFGFVDDSLTAASYLDPFVDRGEDDGPRTLILGDAP